MYRNMTAICRRQIIWLVKSVHRAVTSLTAEDATIHVLEPRGEFFNLLTCSLVGRDGVAFFDQSTRATLTNHGCFFFFTVNDRIMDKKIGKKKNVVMNRHINKPHKINSQSILCICFICLIITMMNIWCFWMFSGLHTFFHVFAQWIVFV